MHEHKKMQAMPGQAPHDPTPSDRRSNRHHGPWSVQTDDPIDTGPWSVQVAEERHLQIARYTHAESTELTPA
ncbi:unnamed protein product [Ceratitis capitata]|uniref:(Mediterranean fruit fly) hypothetical protein n=1 Tax=Ceratitis capitata TaxID=7213 RepID=A0A811UQS7_CERCA|nr:unnamed protein product [Ceratitis capitata]